MKRRAFIGGGMAAILAARRAPAFCIAMRNGMSRPSGAPTPPLPYDSEVEYLESTGTQYIDTGIECAGDCGFSIVGEMLVVTSDESYPVMAGAQFSDWSDWLTIYEGSGSVAVGDDNAIINCRVNEVITAYLNYMDDGKITVETPAPYRSISYTSTNINANIYIFAAGTENGEACLSKSRVYSMAVSSGQNIVRDFIPVRFTNEQAVSEGAMYDRVSGQLFRNAGTGAFTVGPDK